MSLELNLNLAAVVAVLTVTAGITKLLSDWINARKPDAALDSAAMLSQLTELFREMKTDLREVRGTLRDHSEEHRTLVAQQHAVLAELESMGEEVREARVDLGDKILETPEQVAQRLAPFARGRS